MNSKTNSKSVLSILSELTELKQLLENIPPENEIEIISIESRLRKVKEDLDKITSRE